MRKLIYLLMFSILMIGSVMAFNLDATRWNTRGTISSENVDYYFGQEISWAKGRYNAHLNMQRGEVGAGYIYVQVKLADGSKERLFVNWNSRGNRYGLRVVGETDENVFIIANGRVIRKRQVSYETVGIIYNKYTEKLTVHTDDFYISS